MPVYRTGVVSTKKGEGQASTKGRDTIHKLTSHRSGTNVRMENKLAFCQENKTFLYGFQMEKTKKTSDFQEFVQTLEPI